MSLAQAARRIADSYRFQCRLRGALALRLFYVSMYWAAYLFRKRLLLGDDAQAQLFALKFLGRTGLTQRCVGLLLPGGLRLEVDLLTSYFVLKELVDDGMYGKAGSRRFGKDGGVVFDIGAQQGVFSMLASQSVGAAGRVVSFEPEPINYGRLLRNISLNAASNVTALNIALSNRAGTAKFYRSRFNTGAHSLVPALIPRESLEEAFEVKVETLDQAAGALGLKPDLLKIDVEGSVIAVLEGAASVLRDAGPDIVLEMDQPGDMEKIAALLKPLGYGLERGGNILFAARKK